MPMRWEVQSRVYAMLPDGRGSAKIVNAQAKASATRGGLRRKTG